MMAHKFKIGDRIRTVPTDHHWWEYRENFIFKEKVVSCVNTYTWTDLDKNPLPVVSLEDCDVGYIPQMFCELVEPEEIQKVTREFFLPEKWCLKVTKANVQICNKWRTFTSTIHIGAFMHSSVHNYSDRGVSKDSILSGYTEITFEQFQKYVLGEIVQDTLTVNNLVEGEIYKVTDPDTTYFIIKFTGIHDNECRIDGSCITTMGGKEYRPNGYGSCIKRTITIPTQEEKQWLETCISANKFIPKKEALKSKVKKWSVGTYVVFCKERDHRQAIGTIDKIKEYIDKDNITLENYMTLSCTTKETMGQIKWFATVEEAQAFAKTLVKEEVLEYIECTVGYYDLLIEGKTYIKDIENSSKSSYFVIKDNKGRNNSWASSNFKPSTKEAYEAQQKGLVADTPEYDEDNCVRCNKSSCAGCQYNISKPGDPDYAAEVYECNNCNLQSCVGCDFDRHAEEEPNDFKQASDVSDWLVKQSKSYIPIFTETTSVQNVEKLVLLKQVNKVKTIKIQQND